jgi:hypothetical protein
MSKRVFRCAYCGRRVRRGRHSNISVRKRETGKERRYHGANVECLAAAAHFMSQHPRSDLDIHYFHAPPCRARGKVSCGCFAVAGLEEDGAA